MALLAITTYLAAKTDALPFAGKDNESAGLVAAVLLFVFNTFFAVGWLGMTWLVRCLITLRRHERRADALSSTPRKSTPFASAPQPTGSPPLAIGCLVSFSPLLLAPRHIHAQHFVSRRLPRRACDADRVRHDRVLHLYISLRVLICSPPLTKLGGSSHRRRLCRHQRDHGPDRVPLLPRDGRSGASPVPQFSTNSFLRLTLPRRRWRRSTTSSKRRTRRARGPSSKSRTTSPCVQTSTAAWTPRVSLFFLKY